MFFSCLITVPLPPSSPATLSTPMPLLLPTIHSSTFLFRKGQVSYVYQPAMVYQIAVRLGTFSLLRLDEATHSEERIPNAGNRVSLHCC